MTKEGARLALDPTYLISSLFTLIPVPVAIIDQGGRIIISNSAFVELFQGVQNVQAIPHHAFEMAGRGTFDLERLPLNDQGMEIVYAREITNEVQLRQQMVHMEKMAAIGRLVSGVAHELNNPLAGILGYAQLATRNELDASTRRMVEIILAQAERAGKIVQNFLSLSSKTEPTRVAFDLNETIQNVIQLREYQTNMDDIVVTTHLSREIPRAWGDPHQLEQVFLNLIVNAEDAIADATGRHGAIHIRTALEDGRMQVTVTDNGSGIHARDMARIFDPFFTTKDKERGTGLGLSICADIVKDHGGELYAWSTYGAGSTFTLELPIWKDIAQEKERPAFIIREDSLSGKRILVIDDEIHITELMFDVLAGQGATIDLANSGTDALEQIKNTNYDVIICDQRMPGLSGQKLFRIIETSNPELLRRFLFVTGDVVNAQTRRFFAQSGVQYLRKPFQIHELLECIDTMFRRDI
jgi:two-component system, cell cycle sensor histidine kinase and response regulator CckA